MRRIATPAFLILLGLPGLLSLPDLPGVPRWAVLLNPLLLLVAFAFAGQFAAPRCGLHLRSPEATPASRLLQAGSGALLGFALALAGHLARSWWQAAPGLPPSVIEGWSLASLRLGVLYGGVVEEVILRWGVMSLLLLPLRRILARWDAALLLAILLSALLFAALHLPALAASGAPLEAGVVLRTLLLNTVAGLLFGWIFARRDLIAAMLAHAGAHLGFAVAALMA
ncbi:CPBP family glutamic-type intramembrane protease [Sabulicella rubraurantiaca]|uniref:CPBP family glutamic-type intramembrane protease n=1 Tax=Sabulicella rubraurantiaca TaxID=2811429 RepID=UPI001A97549D|nr:CPBP family glutamic-type intramembrane protease [Sabulicella rubraurantiaca]